MTAALHIRLFGGLYVGQEDVPLTGFVSNKVTALLAYLVVTGRAHQRDTLAALLWGEMTDADAKNNLRQALSNLRKVIDPHLIITRETVEWNPAVPYSLDVQQFTQQLQPGREATTALQKAAELYRGDFLAGFVVRDAPEFEEWMLAQRARFRELALHALHNVTQAYLEQGQYDQAIDYATQLLSLDPWRENAHRQLMLALARSGQHTAALQQYETCRRLLADELGVEPSAATIALAGRIRDARQATHQPLPSPTTPLVGRAGELADIGQRLAAPGCRLLTLTGPGGIGKTRLALEVAAASQAQFLNGVCFVPLAGVDPAVPEGVVSALINALAFALAGPNSPRKQLGDHLRSKEMLLLLDNLEHLLAQTSWLNDLLEQAPDVKILATSRERLNLSGEWVVALDGLPVPPGTAPQQMQAGAVEMFVVNARRVRRDFALTAGNAAAIRHICQLVSGLPLGLELASAWVHTLSCAEVAQEIADNLDFLTSTRRDMPTRQRSLRAVFDHSWQLLTPGEQAAFASLSVFHGSFTRESARSVAQMTTSILASLVDKSLVRRQNSRYELHDLLRQYADQQLDEVSRQGLQARHAAHFAQWLAEQKRYLHTPQETEVFRSVSADLDNVRASWQWAVGQQRLDLLEQGLDTLRIFYNEQGRYQEGMEWLEKTAAMLEQMAAPRPGDETVRRLLGKVWTRWAGFCLWGGQRASAAALFQQALPITRQFAEPAELGLLLLNLAYFTVLSGEYAQAQAQFRESLDYYRQADEATGIADALSALGAVCNITGEWEQSRLYLEESVAISRQLQDEHGLRTSLVNLGNVYYYWGDFPRAKAYYLEVLALCQRAGDRSAEAVTLCNLGTVAYDSGDYQEAEAFLRQGTTIFQEINSLHFLIQGMASLGAVHVALARYEQAQSELQWALQKTVAEQIHHMSPVAVYEIGRYFQAVGRAGEALALLYWVIDNPMTAAEQKRDAQKLLPALAAVLGEAQVALRQAQARALDEVAVLEMLAGADAGMV